MPSGATTKADTVNPVIFTEAVDAAFNSKTAFMGSDLVKAGVVLASPKLTGPYGIIGDSSGIGETVRVPYFGWLGEMEDTSDGVALTSRKISQTSEDATVAHSGLMFDLSNWAKTIAVSGPNGEDPYENAVKQLVAAATRRADKALVDAAQTASGAIVTDLYSATAPRYLDYSAITKAKTQWGDSGGRGAVLVVHSNVMQDLLDARDATGKNVIIPPDNDNELARFADGTKIAMSDRLAFESGTLSAVTSAGTTPPVITLTGTPLRALNIKVLCTVLGARGTSYIKYSIDGGLNYSTAEVTAATILMLDPLDGLTSTGVTLNIAAGTAAVDNVWTAATATGKYTSLLCKPASLALWYNAVPLFDALPEPATNSKKAALHLYYAAYRYKRCQGSARPGVVTIKTNASV